MAKYILVYKGGHGPGTSADRTALMRAWRTWVDGLSMAAIDPGNPFGHSMMIAPDGTTSEGGPSQLRGYHIFTAVRISPPMAPPSPVRWRFTKHSRSMSDFAASTKSGEWQSQLWIMDTFQGTLTGLGVPSWDECDYGREYD